MAKFRDVCQRQAILRESAKVFGIEANSSSLILLLFQLDIWLVIPSLLAVVPGIIIFFPKALAEY